MSVSRASLLVLGGLFLASGAFPAAAADDGYDNVLSSVATAVGIFKEDESPEIDYRERAPLVLPPKMDLVKPSQTAARPASWPQDPDVARRRKAAADARAPMPNLLGNEHDGMNKAELLKGRVAGTDSNDRPEISRRLSACGKDGNGCLHVSPDALQAESEHFKANNPEGDSADLKAGEEESRVYLTQPPTGYLKASKIVKATTEAPKVYNRDTKRYEERKTNDDE